MEYVHEWQKALQIEINYLMKYGSTKNFIKNGHLVSKTTESTYYFETVGQLSIPVGSTIRLEWKNQKVNGKVLSLEGKNILLSLEHYFGDLIDEAFLFHDPWELLDELICRLDDIKKSNRKKKRVEQVLTPTMPAKHPISKNKTNSHELFYRSSYNPVTFVWGPPGTGKTYTLARVAANKYFQEKRVLLLSHSNQAVDVLLQEIVVFLSKKNRFQEGDVLRYGTGSKINLKEAITTQKLLEKQNPTLAKLLEETVVEKKLLNNDLSKSWSKRDSDSLLSLEKKYATLLDKVRLKEVRFLKKAKLVGATLAKAATDATIYESEFDLIIIDEASMAYVPQVAFAASLGKRVIVCGDFKQLPPIASARHSLVNQWLKEDIFHLAGVVQAMDHDKLHPHLMLLKEQRRMHPHISAFTNKHIYGGKVFDHPSMEKKRQGLVEKSPFPNLASVLVDTSFTGQHCIQDKSSQSRFNLWQLFIGMQLVHEAFKHGASSVGFVTPYRTQALLMEQLLKQFYPNELANGQVIAATVHRFQGSERDVMIFDTVDSYPQTRSSYLLTGKDSERLVNVAITRTRGKFIHVGDFHFFKNHLSNEKTILKLLEHQTEHGQLVNQSKIGTWIKNQHQHLRWIHALKEEEVFDDIRNANKSLFLSLPKKTFFHESFQKEIEKLSRKVTVTISTNHSISLNRPVTQTVETLPFPLVVIDHEILWLGFPVAGIEQTKPPFVAVRIKSKHFVEYVIKLLQIL